MTWRTKKSSFHVPLLLVLSLLLFAPHILAAQSTPCGTRATMTVAAGMSQHDRADASVSPGQFEGRGAEYLLGASTPVRGLCLVASVHGGARALSAVSGTFGSERLMDADGGLALFRPVAHRGSLALDAGVAARGSIAATQHAFADAFRSVSTFRLGVASLGPAARVRMNVRDTRVDASLSLPVISVVDHSYSALWSGGEAPEPRVAWPGTLRGANVQLAVTRALGRGVGVSVAYSASAVRLDGARPVRTLSQSALLGVTLERGTNQR